MAKGRIYDKLCVVDDSAQAQALAESATAYCGQCGAKAYDPDNLCEPIEIVEQKK